MKLLPLSILLVAFAASVRAEDTSVATNAINSLGVDLLHQTGAPDKNAVLSLYSIQLCLAMAYSGADGKTRDEMATALHFPKDDGELADSFAALRKKLGRVAADFSINADNNELVLVTVNRLYTCKGHAFQKDFLSLINRSYDATPGAVDFKNDPADAARRINARVADDTHGRVLEAIPPGVLDSKARLVLLNAIYLKAKWKDGFDEAKPAPFYVKGVDKEDVDTMYRGGVFSGYAKKDGYTVVASDYRAADLQFVVLLPDERKGLPALEAKLTPQMLAECTHLGHDKIVKLWMPKFQLDPPSLPLEAELKQLGMKTAFNEPADSTDFNRIATPDANELPLYISGIFHKTWLSLDEQGTEAVAVTGGSGYMAPFGTGPTPTPPPEVEVHVDHPFLFVIQEINSGACLFIGRVTQPEFEKTAALPEKSAEVTFPEYFKYGRPQKSPAPTKSPE